MTGVPVTYSRDRSQAHAAGLMWGLLFVVEVAALSVLAVVLLPAVWMKGAAVLALVGGSAFTIARVVLAPLWTHHLLTPDALIVHYGRDRITIPRARIVGIDAVREHLPSGYQSGFSADAAHGRIVAALSLSNQLLIRLDPPLEPYGEKLAFPVCEVLINADAPATLLALVSPLDAAHASPDPLAPQAGSLPHRRRAVPHQSEGGGISCEAVSKRYGDHRVVEDLSLYVAQGEIYGLLGANGAGKSTTIAMLTGITQPDSGRIALAGFDLRLRGLDARRALGYVPDRPILYDTLTGREFLSYIAHMHALPRDAATTAIDDLIDALDLGSHAGSLCRTYSFGTRSKVALAAALLHDPRVLVLDEPFNGLDFQSSHAVRAMLTERANAGTAILLSTHDLAIAETLCDRVGILSQGWLIVEGDLDSLTEGQTIPLDVRFRELTAVSTRRIPVTGR